MTTGAKNRVIRDAIHGLISVDPHFWPVIDSPEIQRLRWIRQTGLAYLVYPGAEHSRFAHMIGTYGVARRVFAHLRQQSTAGLFSPSVLDEDLEFAFTAAALCHDIGHTAFSHVLERILLPVDLKTHEDCTLALLKDGEVGRRIRVFCDLEQVMQLLNGVHWNDGLCKLLSGHVDVDRWDYLMRDAASAGVGYGRYDLDWMINSLSLHLDTRRQPRLLLEVHRGMAAVEQFFSARHSMYQQVYYHATVRSAGRLLRAVFERASDPERSRLLLEDSQRGTPDCLSSFLDGKPVSMGEFLSTDDTTVISAIKAWRNARDPVLKYLANCFFGRRLFKEIELGSNEWSDESASKVKEETAKALKRLSGTDVPSVEIGSPDMDYLVLEDECEFKADSAFEGVFFNMGNSAPKPFEEIEKKTGYEPVRGRRNFTKKRMFVPSEVASSVRSALESQEGQ